MLPSNHQTQAPVVVVQNVVALEEKSSSDEYTYEEVEEEEEVDVEDSGDMLLQNAHEISTQLLMNLTLTHRQVTSRSRGLADAREAPNPVHRRVRTRPITEQPLQVQHQLPQVMESGRDQQPQREGVRMGVVPARQNGSHFRADSCPTTSPVQRPQTRQSPNQAAKKKHRVTNPRQKKRRRRR